MNTQHTPAPWSVVDTGEDYYVSSPNYGNFAVVYKSGRLTTADMDKANARLIAAAPDMLAALRDAEEASGEALSIAEAGDIKEAMDRLVRIQDDLRAAIAKAEGRA